MTVRVPYSHITINEDCFDYIVSGLESNPVVAEWQQLVDAERGIGGVPRQFGEYRVFANLAGTLLLAFANYGQKISNLMSLFWCTLTPEQNERLGVDDVVTDERRDYLTSGHKWDLEYDRFRDDRDRMLSVVDPSPFTGLGRGRRPKSDLDARVADLTGPDGVPTEESLSLGAKQQLLDRFANGILGGFLPSPQDGYGGHLAVDGTMLRLNNRVGGSAPDGKMLHADDHSAGYHGHKPKRHKPGYYYEVHVAKPAPATYGHEVGQLITGFTVRSTWTNNWGGATEPALVVTDAHISNGWGPPEGKHADAVADTGYTNKNGFAEGLLARRYLVTQEYINQAAMEDAK